ncbi:hypothetical protein Zmor_010199 [Zophobas morio]|uniref:Lipoprotein n=1 Tax=Zophobas morio TaxID=2755281 RepID=A0AA38MJF4_9CUCU|nr:hypothetical protein Zmor_010199 [Zophobas morio]
MFTISKIFQLLCLFFALLLLFEGCKGGTIKNQTEKVNVTGITIGNRHLFDVVPCQQSHVKVDNECVEVWTDDDED